MTANLEIVSIMILNPMTANPKIVSTMILLDNIFFFYYIQYFTVIKMFSVSRIEPR